MIRIVLSIFFLGLWITSAGQESRNIQKGNINKDRYFLNKKVEIPIVDDDGNYIAVRPHPGLYNTEYAVEFYSDAALEERIVFETDKDTEILDCFYSSGEVLVLKHVYYRHDASLRVDHINKSTGDKHEEVLLSSNRKEEKDFFKYFEAFQNSYVLLDDRLIITIPFINTEKQLAIKTVVYDYRSRSTTIESFVPNQSLSRKEISYLNTFVYKGRVLSLFSVTSEEIGNSYQIFDMESGTKLTEGPIAFGQFDLINTRIDGDILNLFGLFSYKKRMRFDGYTHYKFDLAEMKFLGNKSTDFRNEDVVNYFSGFLIKKRRIDINNIYSDSEGNFYIIGQTHVVRRQAVPVAIPIAAFTVGSVAIFISVSPPGPAEKIYDDILIAKLDSNGNLLWERLLELGRTTAIKQTDNKRDSSFFTYFEDDKLHILMNGYINQNRNKLVVKQDKGMNMTNFYDISLDPEGALNTNIIFPNEDSEIIFKANNTIIQDGVMYNLGQGNMRKQLMKVN